MPTRVLNLYAGIGGNRKRWDGVDVTAVEYDPEVARVYQDNFPDDNVVVADAHEFLVNHIEGGWDFIWASPPCQTHGHLEPVNQVQGRIRYPDMRLYQEVILLDFHHDKLGFDYVVENVKSYYEPLVEPQLRARHYFWSNFHIPPIEMDPIGISGGFPDRDSSFDYDQHEEMTGFDLSGYDIAKGKKGKMLRNCVHPKLGGHVFNAATKNRQATVADF